MFCIPFSQVSCLPPLHVGGVCTYIIVFGAMQNIHLWDKISRLFFCRGLKIYIYIRFLAICSGRPRSGYERLEWSSRTINYPLIIPMATMHFLYTCQRLGTAFTLFLISDGNAHQSNPVRNKLTCEALLKFYLIDLTGDSYTTTDEP